MSAISSSLVVTKKAFRSGGSGAERSMKAYPGSLKLKEKKKRCKVSVSYSEGDRPNSATIFVGGFVLGGIIVGTLGCVYAPQISKADLMRKLPKFIYDEEKALERTRKVLAEKIAQLNSAIDDVSSQLRSDDVPNGSAANLDEIEASI